MRKTIAVTGVTFGCLCGAFALSPIYGPPAIALTVIQSAEPAMNSARAEREAVFLAMLCAGIGPDVAAEQEWTESELIAAFNAAAQEAADQGGLAALGQQASAAQENLVYARNSRQRSSDFYGDRRTAEELRIAYEERSHAVGAVAAALLPGLSDEEVQVRKVTQAVGRASLRSIRRAERRGEEVSEQDLQILEQVGVTTQYRRRDPQSLPPSWETFLEWVRQEH